MALAVTELLTELQDAGLDRFDSVAVNGVVGDGTTTPSESDTDLVNQTHLKALTAGSRTTSSTIKNLFLDGTENNGNTMNEVGVEKSDGTLLGRGKVTSQAKTSSVEAFYGIKLALEVVNS